MRSFFQNLEKHDVRYLLISGQASVLYGAAQFSEDIDLWLAPGMENLQGFLKVLQKSNASIYKLTPPLTRSYFLRGHGFHFKLPEETFAPAYLDVMARPPRVGSFQAALRHALRIRCDWGNLPVVSIPDLVELKKTRRAADYDVISNLVRIFVNSMEKPKRNVLTWALNNVFRVEDAIWIFEKWPEAKRLLSRSHRSWLKLISTPRNVNITFYSRAQNLLSKEIAKYQIADIRYWSPIIQELRELRKNRMLIPEGTPVSDTIQST